VQKHQEHRRRRDITDQQQPELEPERVAEIQFLLAMPMVHDPAGKYRDAEAADRQHDIRGQIIDQIEKGPLEQFDFGPDIERKHRAETQRPGDQSGLYAGFLAAVTFTFDQPGDRRLDQRDRRG